jgi:hypothetical protein
MAISQRISDVRLTPQFEGFTLCLGHASGAFARAIAHLFRIRSIVDTQTTVVYFADASGLHGGQGYGVSPARDVSKFRFPIFARADSPRVRAGTNVLVCERRNLGRMQ